MTTLLMLAFLGPISWFYHPHAMVNHHCVAAPGSFAALYCQRAK